MRKVFAVICGILAGGLLSSSLATGLHFRFPDEMTTLWGLLFWGEHWFIRAVVSCLCAAWAGFIAGVISRSNGNTVGMLAVLPSWLVWAIALYVGIVGRIPFWGSEVYVSVGIDKIAELREQGWSIRKIADKLKLSVGVVHKTLSKMVLESGINV